jgi:hypothetical protein
LSSEYWLVSEAVPYFTKRLAANHDVSLVHGARMFQLLFAAGWEPTQLHFSLIPEGAWKRHEKEAVAMARPAVTFECLPLQTRLPDKSSVPDCPEDSTVPVRFFLEGKSYMIPLISDEPEVRGSGRYYLDIQFVTEYEDGPYLDLKGNSGHDEPDGEDFCKALLPSVSEEHDDFDPSLREFLFDKLSSSAKRLGSESFYRAWGDYLKEMENEDAAERRLSERVNKIFDRARASGDNWVISTLQAHYVKLFSGNDSSESDHARLLSNLDRFLDTLLAEVPQRFTESGPQVADIPW